MPKPDKELERQLEALALLADPVRRRLYLHVLGAPEEVSRDQAARALRISRALAAFHLDRLVEGDLLETSYRRLTGRTGPGAGRPSKLYRPSSWTIDVTLPARRYELAARVLAAALAAGGPDPDAALERAAEAEGLRIGRERSNGRAEGTARAMGALRAAGFEPRLDSRGEITLHNCPFAGLKETTGTMMCRMNLALCRGLVAGLEQREWSVRSDAQPGQCCVVFGTR